MFDAYTVKKIVPRLVAAVILIQLSWFLFTGLIVVINNIAYGIEALIYAPFGGAESLTLSNILSQMEGASGLGAFSAIAAGLAVGGFALAAGGVLATAGIALLGILIAFGLLLFRQVAIVALLIISPLALVAWILPGTEKWWKMWWDSYFKLLLVYPIILGLLATGRVLASVVAGVGADSESFSAFDNIINFFFVIACVFGPFYLIPKTFQLAGGVFQTLTGTINNKSKGAFDRLRNRRQQTQAKNLTDFKAGSRFSERNAFTRRVNRVGGGIGVGAKGLYGFGERGNQALDLSSQTAAEEALKNPALNKLQFNDDANAVMALSGGSAAGASQAADELMQDWINGGMAAGDAKKKRDRALAGAKAVGFSRANAQGALTTLAQNKSRAISAGNSGIIDRGMNRLAGDNTAMKENLEGSFQFHSRNAGRYDIGASTATAGAARTSLYQLANSQPASINGWGNEIAADLSSGNVARMHNASVAHKELKAMLPNATGESRNAIVDQINRLESIGAVGGGPGTLSQHDSTDYIRQDTEILDREKMDNTNIRFDPNYVAHVTTNWTAAEQAAGTRQYDRTVKYGKEAEREARTYERPDPNHI